MAGAATGSDSPGLRLARARERLGLSIDQVSEKLRLEPPIVAALEADDHRAVGAAVFVRGFLRRYADLVKESHDEIDALYLKMPEAGAAPDLTSTGMRRLEPAAHRPRLGVPQALLAVTVLGVLAAIWWGTRASQSASEAGGASQAQVLHIDESDASGTDRAAAEPPRATPRALEGTGAAVAGGPAVAASASAAGATPGAVPPANAAAIDAAAPPPRRRHLQVTFNGECWAEVYDARGARLYFGFGHAGTTQALVGVAPFRLVLGNVGAVAVAVEGANVALPEAQPGARLRVSLNGNGAVASVR